MKKVKGIGQWSGKSVPGMYQSGGENKNILKNSKGDISKSTNKPTNKSSLKKGPDISTKRVSTPSAEAKLNKYSPKDLKNSPGVKNTSKKLGKKAGKRIIKQIAKKLGPIGVAYTAYDILKDPKGALDQLKTDVKNVKNFIKGNKKKTTSKPTYKKGKDNTQKTSKKKDTRPSYIKKRDKDYTPQSRKK
jgi:hypothetical protein